MSHKRTLRSLRNPILASLVNIGYEDKLFLLGFN